MNRRIILGPPPNAPSLLSADAVSSKLYWDRSHYDSPASQIAALSKSKTLYVGNLSFTTRVSHLRSLFSSIGLINAVHMGLDRYQKTPCGFAFVEYHRREHALDAIAFLSGAKLDGKVIRVELDAGFKPGRQYGRGASGGQVRDDRRRQSSGEDPKRRSFGSNADGRLGFERRWQAPEKLPASADGYYGPGKRGRESNTDEDDFSRSNKTSRFKEEDD